MAKRRNRRARTKRPPRSVYWRGQIQEWISSGLTQVEFCEQRELSVAALRWWRWKLKQEDAESPAASVSQDSASERMRWVPVRVVDREAPTSPPLCASFSDQESADFEVRLPSGIRIRVPDDFDAASLGRLLRTLETVRC